MRPKRPTQAPPGRKFDFTASQVAEATPRPVAAMADSLPKGEVIPPHCHRRAQLIFAVRGTMTIQAGGGRWTVPPSHALWVPAGVVHEVRTHGPVEMRTLYVQPRHAGRMTSECRVLFVSALLRELILRAIALPRLYDPSGMGGAVMRLILDETASLPAQPLGLRMPRDPRLLRLCGLLLDDLAGPVSISRLGASVGLSQRSVMRLFLSQTGMNLRHWRNQARLLKAFELFEQGRGVTSVALEVGYSSPSAFSKMFRRAMGKVPTEMLQP
jgi:AraC-like DNA-binding protein/quercetin dioxygenase-like cupin family protein